ncbi:hypothetical protein DP939_02520 [Spongiactinospora rosea]|uniref:Uncharacterized protein n=1 Tax=Spongiactinospora rosea TaxID=2248750 RepID=A0A366M700_9ACTN|nr:hypothetical protein [Spongiactinospora rosea]RBQ21603.1 hypothetical protein DP939_02520 [Spongiactinospora rosea]
MTLTIPVERISHEARRRDVRAGLRRLVRALATLLVGVPYVLGWAAGRLWLGLTIAWVAAGEGWREGRRSHPGAGGRSR